MKLLITYIPFQVLLGVLLGILFPVSNIYIVCVFPFVILLTMFFLHCFMMKRLIIHQFFFLLLLMFGMSLSWFSQVFRNELSKENHYTKFVSKSVTTKITLTKQLTTTKASKRFYATVKTVNNTVVTGEILVEFPINKPSNLQIGDVLMCKTRFREINLPSSPYDFNYKTYLARQYVYAKIILDEHYIKLGEDSSWFIQLQKLRNSISTSLDKSNLSSDTIGLMKAMLLGDKDGVTDEMQTSFTNSGVVHIIAISGMHVGVLYFMLLYTFGFVKRIRYGDYIYVIIVLLCLWSFAIFSGLSSSVIRSVTMFSFFTLTKLTKGKRLVLEAVISSMLVLLLIDTQYLYNVGFQLSYAAVISIVVFYPLFSKWIKVNNKIAQYFIDVLVVSVIAQLGVLPLSLYYFHQIPLQFLGANFFAVSLLPLVLYGGIIVLIKVMFTIQNSFIEYCYNDFITFYLNSVQYFSSYSKWILKDISFKETEILYYYVFLFCVWYVVKVYSIKRFKQALCFIVICQLILLIEVFYKKENKEELLIYNHYAHSIVAVRNNFKMTIFSKDSLAQKDSILLKGNQLKNKINQFICNESEVFNFKNNTYLIINNNKPYYLLSQKGLILIIANNPKINFERLLKHLKPKQVIIESSNYISNQLKWKSTCKKLQVPFYSIAELGAYQKN
ncbi:ComEC/Rec2 family competence protein [Wenyingzhuangia sp. IMCC45467]